MDVDEHALDVLVLVALMDAVAAVVPADVVALRPEAHWSPSTRVRVMPIDVTVEMPFDWLGSVVVPAAAILISSGIAIWAARAERKRSEAAAVRAEAAELVRALSALGRAAAYGNDDERNACVARFEQQLSAFSAQLPRRDGVVAKFISVVSSLADVGPDENLARTCLWLVSVIELWLRGDLKRRDFRQNMPPDVSTWVERVHLADQEAIRSGRPVEGFPLEVRAAERHGDGA